MKFKDYSEILGVSRDFTEEIIESAYRNLARKFQPDVSKVADAETRFKELGETYPALKDPENRAAYDQIGSQWKSGQDFQPPPGWDAGFEFNRWHSEPGRGIEQSEFFESLCGLQRRSGPSQHLHAQERDHHAKGRIDLAGADHGAQRKITLRMPVIVAQGHTTLQSCELDVSTPKGILAGQHLRLAGQGDGGSPSFRL